MTQCGQLEKQDNDEVSVEQLKIEEMEVNHKIDVWKLKEAFKNITDLKDYIATDIKDINHLRAFIEFVRLQDMRNQVHNTIEKHYTVNVPQKQFKMKQIQYRKKTYVDEDLNFFVQRNRDQSDNARSRPVTKAGLRRVGNPLIKQQKQQVGKLPQF